MVGDGMGPSFNTAYRYYKNKPGAKKMTPTAFDKYLKEQIVLILMILKKMLQTLLLENSFSTGHKTYNGAISVDTNKNQLNLC